jgi:predicted LPLAT superfamily acyltransferase
LTSKARTSKARTQDWTARRERGSVPVIKACVWVALTLGRRLAGLFLYPVCLYFLLSSPAASRASKGYLGRVLGRRARTGDVFAHFLTFASCLLDRVFLLNEQTSWFDITVHGEEIVRDIEAQGGGCLLFGAHFGSFEVARVLGRRRELPISLLMYEENAQKIRAALAAINPRLATEVIGLGRADSLLMVADRLRQGHFIGVLADRNVDGRDMAKINFLGAPAAFPRGPFRVAMMLQRPVVLMVGMYKGGRRYEVHFELLSPALTSRPVDSQAWLEDIMGRYAARLEQYCREAPRNWFNFFDFWA